MKNSTIVNFASVIKTLRSYFEIRSEWPGLALNNQYLLRQSWSRTAEAASIPLHSPLECSNNTSIAGQLDGNKRMPHVKLGEGVSLFGHDSFLLDLEIIAGSVELESLDIRHQWVLNDMVIE